MATRAKQSTVQPCARPAVSGLTYEIARKLSARQKRLHLGCNRGARGGRQDAQQHLALVLGEAMRRIHGGESVTSLFKV